ncbi:MAG TPA: family 78 glycoside hydrolase catalytic domain, partial [Chthonomonadaceae bacterium]|nr:family 78 glycoside hydrolase catalytic domain [Chthonomonadaceae bacterium]
MNRHLFLFVALGLLLDAFQPAVAGAPLPAPDGLMCNLLAKPELTEITDPHPAFSWVVRSSQQNEVQRAYEIRVAASVLALTDPKACLWTTGRVPSDQNLAVVYAGHPLESRHNYWWTVRICNGRGAISDWATPQHFQTGVLRNPLAPMTQGERITVDRYPIVQTEVAPVRLVTIGSGHLFADFGRDAFAGLKLTLSAAHRGKTLTVHLGEALDMQDHIDRNPGGSRRYLRVDLPLQVGKHTYIVPLGSNDGRRMPDAIGPVMPYRYVELENYPATPDKRAITQVTAHYPFDDEAAAFTSSDPRLNAVWDLCRYSMKATSCFGVYVDGDRERTPYEADAYINQLGHYGSDREFTLARYSLETLILEPTWPTEWCLHTLLMAWADYLYTGDTRCIAAFYDDLKAKTLIGLARDDGLISTTNPPPTPDLLAALHADNLHLQDIVDWP